MTANSGCPGLKYWPILLKSNPTVPVCTKVAMTEAMTNRMTILSTAKMIYLVGRVTLLR